MRPLFGWKRADGRRRFRKAFIAVPKKNGKTHLCAGLGLYLTFCDHEEEAEVFAAAADRAQAGLVFDAAKAFVEDSAELSRLAEVLRRAITLPGEALTFKVLSADVKSKHGPNVHGLIFDELHAQPNRDLWETLTKGTASRRQPVTIAITTAGVDQESICAEEWGYALGVRAGTIPDDTTLPVVFAAKPDDDWEDPATWARANPGLGKTVPLHYLEAEVAAAKVEPRKQAALGAGAWQSSYFPRRPGGCSGRDARREIQSGGAAGIIIIRVGGGIHDRGWIIEVGWLLEFLAKPIESVWDFH